MPLADQNVKKDLRAGLESNSAGPFSLGRSLLSTQISQKDLGRKNYPDLSEEARLGAFVSGERFAVCGIDEVGRGCIAGPVVVASAVLPESLFDLASRNLLPDWVYQIRDSKLLSAKVREELEPNIKEWLTEFKVIEIASEQIDQMNILQATLKAMVDSVEALSQKPRHVLIDGNQVPRPLKGLGVAVVGGDLKCLSIAAASILAKVHRDRIMGQWSEKFPEYGFAKHKGYGTAEHLKAIKKFGLTKLHRRSFAPVRQIAESTMGLDLAGPMANAPTD